MKKMLSFLLALVFLVSCGIGAVTAGAEGIKPEIVDTVPHSTFTLDELVYDGPGIYDINDMNPDFYVWQLSEEPYVHFSKLDELGRAGPAMALLSAQSLASEDRGQMGNVYPSGWQSTRYDDIIEGRFLYNRSHLIAYQLCGDLNSPENLITGTSYLNTILMPLYEESIAMYVQNTGDRVLYRVTPVYEGDNLVASGVQLEAMSVSDMGGNVLLNIYISNFQPGIVIDYATGESRVDETGGSDGDFFALEDPGDSSAVPDRTAPESPSPTPAATSGMDYVLNTNTKKFHYPWCDSVKDIKQKNRMDFTGTRDEVISMGYVPCKRCYP